MHRPLVVLAIVSCLLSMSLPAWAVDQSYCKIYGFSIDDDPKGLNVRSGPSSKHQVLGRVARINDRGDVYWPHMEIIGSQGNWLQVTNITIGMAGEPQFSGTGWVYGPLVGVAAKRSDNREVVDMRRRPDRGSAVTGKIPWDRNVKVVGCQGNWAYVDYNGAKGWLAPENQCGTMETTCP